ncbi:amidase [Bradyrhizobium sp. Pear77]|uniref:amidase n=1 Tax=Bradyrhizobium TaxID=374 RepID=UPI001E4F426C|nr:MULTISPECIES: amidase family protein [Bradyrhizobium]MCC8954368.1 amidase [Bradyrhizobium altum]MCC8964372.1 amidase [Bradyrhizobium oropedii]
MSIDGEIRQLHQSFSKRELSPVEIVRAQLDAVIAVDAGVNAFTLVDETVAIEMAQASEERYRRGEPIGPMDGIPTTIKDTLNVAGWPTRRGSRTTPEAPATADAVSVARLRSAGAVFLGKTTTPEFAWKGLTQSLLNGMTLSPLDKTRHAGGSSGGAAAATALGVGVVGIGTDAAGSVRIPAAFCGVVGYKPTFGAIPLEPFPAAFWQLPHIGPITRSVADAALAAAVMSGPASSDWMSLVQTPLSQRLERKLTPRARIGIPTDLNRYLDPEVKRGWDEAVRALSSQADIKSVELRLDEARDIVATLYRLGCAFAVSLVPESKRSELDPAILEFIEPVRNLPAETLIDMQRRREEIASQAALVLSDTVDVLLTPTMPCLPLRADSAEAREVDWFKWCPFTPLFNLSRGPAISVPWPSRDNGVLPIGLQIGAAPGRDELAISAAAVIESIASRDRARQTGASNHGK